MSAIRAYCDVCDKKVEPKKTRDVNHILHFILSFLTAGIWLLFWLLASMGVRTWTCPICKANLESSVSKAKKENKEAILAAEAEENAPILQRLLTVVIGLVGVIWCYSLDTKLLADGLSWYWYAPFFVIIVLGLGGGSIIEDKEDEDGNPPSISMKVSVFIGFYLGFLLIAWVLDWIAKAIF